ncbi:MAG: NrsF family protein [Polyangiaceae bacterium]
MNVGPSADLKARVLEAARARPSKARRRGSVGVLVPYVVAALVTAAILEVSGGARHADGRPAPMGAAVAIGSLLFAALATMLTTRRRSMLGPRSALLWTVVIATPLALAAWTIAWHVSYVDPFERLGVRCFALSMLSAPWIMGALINARRTLDPVHPRLFGAALGTVAGAWAGVMVVLWCPLADPGHVVRGHVTPFIVLALAGAWFGQRVFAVRRDDDASR